MGAHDSVSQQFREHGSGTSRRSWLASMAAGIAALASFPARAHEPDSETGAKVRSFADLRRAQPENVVERIVYRLDAYRVWTADGKYSDFAVADLRFAIDPSAVGPASNRPVQWPSGQGRDRALVFFSKPDEVTTFVRVIS